MSIYIVIIFPGWGANQGSSSNFHFFYFTFPLSCSSSSCVEKLGSSVYSWLLIQRSYTMHSMNLDSQTTNNNLIRKRKHWGAKPENYFMSVTESLTNKEKKSCKIYSLLQDSLFPNCRLFSPKHWNGLG